MNTEMIQKGDTVMLIAPSSPLKPTEEVNLETIIKGMEAMGWRVREGKALRMDTRKGYAAGPAKVRADDIMTAFTDDSVKGIWAVKGGSMAVEVLPLLDYEIIKQHPKPLFGFSDVTALHMAIHEKCGFVTYHAPNGTTFARQGADSYSIRRLLSVMNMGKSCAFENPEGQPIRVQKDGYAEGTLVGGNLSLITDGIGTPYGLRTGGKILFMEDVNESIYKLNKMLIQMKLAGMFENVRGILLGIFESCENEHSADYTVEDMLDEFFEDFKVPVYHGLSVGHIKDNATLPLGARCVMENGKIMFYAE